MRDRRRWFSGYNVAFASIAAYLATAPGQTFIISQLNEPLRDAFDIDELTLNTSYTIATVVASLPLVTVGALSDRFGPRRMMALIALAFGGACLFLSGVTGAMGVFAAFFLLRFLGQGSLSLVSQHSVAMWFHRRLGTVHGVKLTIAFGLWIAAPPLTLAMIQSLGWRQTYAIFGVAIWLTIVPLALWLVRDRPEDVGHRMDNDPPAPATPDGHRPRAAPDEPAFTLREALRTRAYWTIAAAAFLTPLIGTALLFDIQPLFASKGLGRGEAAAAVSVWTGTMCVMALPSGWLTDRFRPSALISAGMALIAMGPLVMLVAPNAWIAYAAMTVYGVGQSAVMASGSATLARYFGRASHGAIRSSVTRLGVFGTGLGPLATGASVALTGNHAAALIGFSAISLPVLLLSATLRKPGEGPGSGKASEQDG